jgi:hypothetical protein
VVVVIPLSIQNVVRASPDPFGTDLPTKGRDRWRLPRQVKSSPCGEGWEGSCYRFVSFSFLRTSSGPMIFAPMLSTTETAFSTSWALVASWPLPT